MKSISRKLLLIVYTLFLFCIPTIVDAEPAKTYFFQEQNFGWSDRMDISFMNTSSWREVVLESYDFIESINDLGFFSMNVYSPGICYPTVLACDPGSLVSDPWVWITPPILQGFMNGDYPSGTQIFDCNNGLQYQGRRLQPGGTQVPPSISNSFCAGTADHDGYQIVVPASDEPSGPTCGDGVCQEYAGENYSNCNISSGGDCSAPPPDFTVTLNSPKSKTINAGQTAYYPITIQAIDGMSGTVNMSRYYACPNNATCNFTVTNVSVPNNGMASTTFRVVTAANTPLSTYSIGIRGRWNSDDRYDLGGLLTINVTRPDLIAEVVLPGGSVSAGNMDFRVNIRNSGAGSAGSSQARLRIDIGNNGSWDLTPGNATTGALSSGASESENWNASINAGTHRFEFCADINNSVSESNESNNCVVQTFTATVAPINGTCGTANGKTYASSITQYSPDTQCGNGSSSNTSFPAAGTSVNWTCSGQNGGSTSASCTASRAAVPGLPTITLTANPTSIAYNTSSNISWTITNATSCTGTNMPAGNWSTGTTNSTGVSTGNITTSTTYSLSCTGPGGTGNGSVTVTVAPLASCDTGAGSNFMKGCLYDGMAFNTITTTAVNQSALSSPAPDTASPIPYRDWGNSGPDSSNTNTYSIRSKGTFNFTAGNYIFTIGGDDGVRLYFDNNLDGSPDSGYLVNDWSDHGYRTVASTPVAVTAGNKTLVMEYYENGGGASYSFSWAKQASAATVDINAGQTTIPYNTGTNIIWSSNGASGGCTVSPTGWTGTSGNQATGNLTSSRTYTATCQPGNGTDNITITVQNPTVNVSVNKTGQGTVVSNPGGINCGADCSETYAQDSNVTLIATPATGRIFVRWTGNCSGTNPSYSFTVSSSVSCTANFAIDPTYQEF
ncbi:MAG TPA: CARDB domain-containing protein [Candidatus Paceibacterota bacterium]